MTSKSQVNKTYGVIKVRIPMEELEILNHRVARAGVSREEYVRRALAGTAIVETPPADYRLILRRLDEIQDELEDVIDANPALQNNVRLYVMLQNVAGTANALMQVMRPKKIDKNRSECGDVLV